MADEYIRREDVVPIEPQEIGYDQCANAMLKMWIDNVVTDYEQKQQIAIGYEVKVFERKPFIVTGFGYGDNAVYCHGFVTENGISTSAKKDECVKTGRYFPEIAEVMQKAKR